MVSSLARSYRLARSGGLLPPRASVQYHHMQYYAAPLCAILKGADTVSSMWEPPHCPRRKWKSCTREFIHIKTTKVSVQARATWILLKSPNLTRPTLSLLGFFFSPIDHHNPACSLEDVEHDFDAGTTAHGSLLPVHARPLPCRACSNSVRPDSCWKFSVPGHL